jgi:hypothetical protein
MPSRDQHGAIIGGLAASVYTPAEIEALFLENDLFSGTPARFDLGAGED